MAQPANQKRRSSKKESANKDWGFDYLLNRLLKKAEEFQPSQRTAYGAILLSTSAILVVIASILEYVVFANLEVSTTISGFVLAIISFPAAIFIFIFFAAFVHLRREEGEETAREKKSYAQRRRISIFLGAALLVGIFFTGSFLPYAVGGTMVVLGVLFIYNYLRRTPDEIDMHQAGLIDPRDLTEEELAIAQAIEDGTIEIDEDFFLDEEETIGKGDR